MNRFPVELVIYALLFAAILLFNYVIQRIARWQKRQQERAQTPSAEERVRGQPKPRASEEEFFGRTQRKPPAPIWEPAPRPRRAEGPALAPAAAQRRPQVRPFLAGRHNLRRAIISMTVLGPCRAQQPHDFR